MDLSKAFGSINDDLLIAKSDLSHSTLMLTVFLIFTIF